MVITSNNKIFFMFSCIIFINIERIETANSIQQKGIKKGGIVPLLHLKDFNTYSITYQIARPKAPTLFPKYSLRPIKGLQSK